MFRHLVYFVWGFVSTKCGASLEYFFLFFDHNLTFQSLLHNIFSLAQHAICIVKELCFSDQLVNLKNDLKMALNDKKSLKWWPIAGCYSLFDRYTKLTEYLNIFNARPGYTIIQKCVLSFHIHRITPPWKLSTVQA